MTRHAPTLTARPDSRTVARQGSPFGPRTGWSGIAATSKQLDGGVLGKVPQRRVERAEQRPRVAVPAPRQVGGYACESVDPFGDGWAARFGVGHPPAS